MEIGENFSDDVRALQERLCSKCIDSAGKHEYYRGCQNSDDCTRRLKPITSNGKDCPYFRTKEWYDR